MFALAALGLIAAVTGSPVSGDEILARVVDTTTRRALIPYSGLREYKVRNLRFDIEARVFVRMTYRPAEGKQFAVLERSGSPKLAGIIDKVLASESEESRPSKSTVHEIGPRNYRTYLLGTETVGGRPCYVIELKPRHKSKFLIHGTLWVDSGSYGVVRLEGSTAASVSMWVGTPRIVEEFSEMGGLWLPSYVRSVASGMLLGTSELEIRYTGYRVGEVEPSVGGSKATDAGSSPAPDAATQRPGVLLNRGVRNTNKGARDTHAASFSWRADAEDKSRQSRLNRGCFALFVTPKNTPRIPSPKSL